MTDLNSLLIFAEVVDARSFSAAARRLKLARSTVSRRVAELEDHLGNRHVARPVRASKDFAAEMALRLFPALPR